MKLTANQLRKIIKEEVAAINEVDFTRAPDHLPAELSTAMAAKLSPVEAEQMAQQLKGLVAFLKGKKSLLGLRPDTLKTHTTALESAARVLKSYFVPNSPEASDLVDTMMLDKGIEAREAPARAARTAHSKAVAADRDARVKAYYSRFDQ